MDVTSRPTKLYSATELAQECGIGITKARELMASGEVQSVKIGKLRKVRHDALVSYLDSLSVSP